MKHPERKLIISILAEAFKQNPRIQSMIKRTHQNRHMHTLAEYAYYIIGKHQGIYLSEDKSTVLMYYRNSHYHRSVVDYLKYGWAFLKAVRISQLRPALKREKLVSSLRKPYDDHIYVWALATAPGTKGLRGLADIRDHLFGLSEELQLPILIETTVERMLGFYRYVGFEQYHHWHDPHDGIDVWFLERKVKSA